MRALERIGATGAELTTLDGALDTTAVDGARSAVFGLVVALRGFQSGVIGRKTSEGMRASGDRGRLKIGRPRSLDEEKVQTIRVLVDDGRATMDQICAAVGASRSTVYRFLKDEQENEAVQDLPG